MLPAAIHSIEDRDKRWGALTLAAGSAPPE